MLNKINAFVLAVVLAQAVVIGALTLSPPSPYATQHASAEQKSGPESPQRHQPKSLWIPEDSTGFFTLWIAGFTGVLAIGTLFMWGATKKAADAAALNAQAVINSERAYLFIIIEFENCTSVINRAAKFAGTPSMNPAQVERLRITYNLANLGKTPAILKQISHQLVLSAQMPDTYVVPDDIVAGVISAERTTRNMDCEPESVFTVGDAQSVDAGTTSLWFHGYAIYDDVFGREIEFRYRWQCSGEGLRLDYHREFIKEQKNS